MANEVIDCSSLVPASEFLSRTTLAIYEIVYAAKAVLIQKEGFKKFPTYLEKTAFILKEFCKLNISYSGSLNNVVEILNKEIRVAKQLAAECSTRNKVYVLIYCRKIVKSLESSTKDISRVLGLFPLASLDVSLSVKEEIKKLCTNMLNADYQAALVEEEILEKIELRIREKNVDQSYANNLLFLLLRLLASLRSSQH